MPRKERKGIHQKQKMLYLMKIFSEETDDAHFLSLAQIIKKLSSYGVTADRKTLYTDFDELRDFGFDIIKEKVGRNYYYHIGSRKFELPELKLLVDAVQSAKAITNKKSGELISKLEGMVSIYEARQLNRQVFISGRIKSMNESIYYNIDALHTAIGADSRIRFKYYQWNIKKEMRLRREGTWYNVSPWALMWDDENYYLVGYDSEDDKIKHYRVDKMQQITATKEPREGQAQFKKFNMPRYSKSLFGMFGGEEIKVTLEAENSMVGILIDRFGKDISIKPVDGEHFQTSVNVAVSLQFFGWVMALGNGVRIVGPESVKEQMQNEVKRLCRQYGC